MSNNEKPQLHMTPGQKRLLRLVQGLGVFLVAMFLLVASVIIWKIIHLH